MTMSNERIRLGGWEFGDRLSAEKDPVKSQTYDTQAYVKDFQLRYIPQCSHWVQQEQPNLVNQYMRDFLKSDRVVEVK